MKIGTKVKVELHKRHHHIGEYLGFDILGNHKVGVLETTIPGVCIKPGKKYISVFNTTLDKLKAV